MHHFIYLLKNVTPEVGEEKLKKRQKDGESDNFPPCSLFYFFRRCQEKCLVVDLFVGWRGGSTTKIVNLSIEFQRRPNEMMKQWSDKTRAKNLRRTILQQISTK